MRAPWWEQFAGRLDCEFSALQAASLRFSETPHSREGGLLQVEVWLPLPDRLDVRLVATYPESYPYTRPEVAAPDENLGRHQHAVVKNLCLLPRGTDNWDTDWTLAQYIQDRVPMVFAAADAWERGAASPVPEQPQGEPFTDYYQSRTPAVVLLDGSWSLPAEIRHGTLSLDIDQRDQALRGCVAEIRGQGRELLATDAGVLGRAFPNSRRITGRWVRLAEPPPQAPDGSLRPFDAAIAAAGFNPSQPLVKPKHNSTVIDVLGVVFPEEVSEGTYADGWVFRVQTFDGRMPAKPYLARAARAGRDDLRARTPETRFLQDKTVLVVGLGGVGAPATLELARAGVGTLRLLDHDIVEAGPVVRWPLGLEAVGRRKVDAIHEWITRNLPYTTVETCDIRLGATRAPGPGVTERDVIEQFLTGADLLLDMTAEYGIHVYLADLAREYGIPYVEASTRAGAWSGIVARVLPGEDRPCWICYSSLLRDLEASGRGPLIDDSGVTQPHGCADPTFTGVGFDVGSLGLEAARHVTSTLGIGIPGAYPDAGWDLVIVNRRGADGTAKPPDYTVFNLAFAADCPRHGGRA